MPQKKTWIDKRTCMPIWWKDLVAKAKSIYWQINNTSFATAEALAAQVSQENYDKGLIYPPFSNIRKISAHIAAKVAAKAYDLG